MGKLRDGDKTSQIAQVGAFVVKLDQTVMLSVVTATKWCEDFVVAERAVHGTEHAGDELVNSVTLLNQGNQAGNLAFVVDPPLKLAKTSFWKDSIWS